MFTWSVWTTEIHLATAPYHFHSHLIHALHTGLPQRGLPTNSNNQPKEQTHNLGYQSSSGLSARIHQKTQIHRVTSFTSSTGGWLWLTNPINKWVSVQENLQQNHVRRSHGGLAWSPSRHWNLHTSDLQPCRLGHEYLLHCTPRSLSSTTSLNDF